MKVQPKPKNSSQNLTQKDLKKSITQGKRGKTLKQEEIKEEVFEEEEESEEEIKPDIIRVEPVDINVDEVLDDQ